MDQKYWESPQKYWEIPRKYLNKIKGKRIYNSGKSIKKKRKPFNYKYWETDTKYSEIPQQF